MGKGEYGKEIFTHTNFQTFRKFLHSAPPAKKIRRFLSTTVEEKTALANPASRPPLGF